MRSEEEMFRLILAFARENPLIRAVGLNGSRVNNNVPGDCFQDYDVAFLVEDMDFFICDEGWLEPFGERIILQKPEAMSLFPPSLGGWFSYLVQFADGNRVDFLFLPVQDKERYRNADKLTRILLDKNALFSSMPEPTDVDYHVKKPTEEHFRDCCNEFWWVSTYVAKGLWRGELLYATEHLNSYVRPSLLRMLSWKVGLDTDFSLSVGKCYKYLHKYLSLGEWSALRDTYRLDGPEFCWKALFSMAEHFRESARSVGDRLGYAYNQEEDTKVSGFLRRVRALPPDATEII